MGRPSSPVQTVDRVNGAHRSSLTLVVAVVLLYLGYLQLGAEIAHRDVKHHEHTRASHSHDVFHWSQIKPSAQLQFKDCFDGLKCARLDVPMDWQAKNHSQLERVAIAMVKIPAKVTVTDPRYGGSILINPGGPGGSGVAMALTHGRLLQDAADSGDEPKALTRGQTSEALYYDVIGFDPRGVNNTTPALSCFPDDFSRMSWHLQRTAQGLITSNATFLPVYNRISGLAAGCSNPSNVMYITRFMSTPYVVEDIVAISERLGELREAEARKLLSAERVHQENREAEIAVMIERLSWKKNAEPTLFWGFSYGTLLGATFAAMHPERVQRMMLDGVADAVDYYTGRWLNNLQDTDKIMSEFYTQCHLAGSEACPLYSPESSLSIEASITKLLATVLVDPIPVAATDTYGPDLITYTDIMDQVTVSLYQPKNFPSLAALLAPLLNRNGSALAAHKQSEYRASCAHRGKKCRNPVPSSFGDDIGSAVICTDGPDFTNSTPSAQLDRWHQLTNQSRLLGSLWTEVGVPCTQWHARAKWDFHDIAANLTRGTKTKNPILWVSNRLDPVTPKHNAFTMQGRFKGSGVLVQDGIGHCAMANPGVCLVERVRAYWQTGEVKKEQWCGGQKPPFEEDEDGETPNGQRDEGGRQKAELAQLVQRLRNWQRISSGPLGV